MNSSVKSSSTFKCPIKTVYKIRIFSDKAYPPPAPVGHSLNAILLYVFNKIKIAISFLYTYHFISQCYMELSLTLTGSNDQNLINNCTKIWNFLMENIFISESKLQKCKAC